MWLNPKKMIFFSHRNCVLDPENCVSSIYVLEIKISGMSLSGNIEWLTQNNYIVEIALADDEISLFFILSLHFMILRYIYYFHLHLILFFFVSVFPPGPALPIAFSLSLPSISLVFSAEKEKTTSLSRSPPPPTNAPISNDLASSIKIFLRCEWNKWQLPKQKPRVKLMWRRFSLKQMQMHSVILLFLESF